MTPTKSPKHQLIENLGALIDELTAALPAIGRGLYRNQAGYWLRELQKEEPQPLMGEGGDVPPSP